MLQIFGIVEFFDEFFPRDLDRNFGGVFHGFAFHGLDRYIGSIYDLMYNRAENIRFYFDEKPVGPI